MAKVQGSLAEPVQERRSVDLKLSFTRMIRSMQKKMEIQLFKRGLILFICGFLLGRAFILSTLSPFALPFFAAAFVLRRDKSPAVFVGVVAGSLTVSMETAIYSFGIISLFLIMNKLTKRFARSELSVLPTIVFLSVFIGRFTIYYIEMMEITAFNVLMTGVEASLAFVLTLIFIQSIPLFSISNRRQGLKTEEIICLIILLASMLTGTIGWMIEGMTMAHVFARYLVLIFAFTAGAAVGSTVGVVTGLIFGLAHIDSFPEMSLLAFSGLLGGLLKEGKKMGVAVGLIIATLLLGMYGSGNTPLSISLYETLIASILFFITPYALTNAIAKHIPGTPEFSAEQQAYIRRIRDATSSRVNQFSNIFTALAESFQKQQDRTEQKDKEHEMNDMLASVTEKTCQNCFKREHCWVFNLDKTYDTMVSMMTELQENNGTLANRTEWNWEGHCARSKKVIDAMQKELYYQEVRLDFNKRIQESREIVAEQLFGVSEVMGNFAKEITKERENNEKQEDQLLDAMLSIGLEVENIEIYSLDKGNVDVDVTTPYCDGMGQCEKLIAPLLSNILGETIVVHSEECGRYPNDHCHATFRSAKRFTVDTGVAYAAKNGGFLSGDSFTEMEIGARKFALAISDGMGNGERAHLESKETLELLQKILQSGIDEEVAIKSINSILSLRTTDEIYATLDLAIVDLQDASSRFIKVGSTPSFIKRGNKVIKIQASNLPIGIIKEFDVDVVSEQLKAEDLLIMMSDGVFEGPKYIENIDIWMKRKIQELETNDPQEIADIILEEVIRTRDGSIDDDMTVFVAKIKHNTPKWKTIPAISLKKLA